MPSLASGELLPFGYQVIEITGHSDMWGEYRDLLVCKVSVTQQSRYDRKVCVTQNVERRDLET